MKSNFDNFETFYVNNFNNLSIPTVFIHGIGLDNTMWEPQKKQFKNNNVIFYDLLNHGKSKKGYKKLEFEDFNNQLIRLINFLEIKKLNLVGFSLGALIAQHFASKNYDRMNKLIIISSVYKRSRDQQEKIRNRYALASTGKNISKDSINRWFNSEYLKLNPNVYNFFNKILENKKLSNFLPAYKLFMESDNYKINFRNINIPTLIMTGENDIGSTQKMSEMINKKIKKSSISIIPEAKHMATYEKKDLINLQISNFLF